MQNDIYCNNCGKTGHLYHQCKLPITSIGIVAFRMKDNVPEFLMIRRKDSLGYIGVVQAFGKVEILSGEPNLEVMAIQTNEVGDKLCTTIVFLSINFSTFGAILFIHSSLS